VKRQANAVVAGLFLFVALSVFPAFAEAIEITKTGFGYSHFAGARFGAWAMLGDETVTDGVSQPVELSAGALYGEFFYAHRVHPMISAEISIGVFSQGDITYDAGSAVYYYGAKVYPILISAKFYPFSANTGHSMHPYLRAGGGVAYGTRDAIDPYYYGYDYFIEDTETKFTYAVGAGVDWAVASQIGLNLDFKYVPIKFGKPLAGFKDYSGWQLVFGVGYIFQSKKH